MILNGLLLLPLTGGLVAWLTGLRRPTGARWSALVFLGAYFVAVSTLWIAVKATESTVTAMVPHPVWLLEFKHTWIPEIGARYHLALDGLGLMLLALTGLLGLMALAASWQRIQQRAGFYYFHLLLVISALTGVFLAADLLLFYFFWEIMLVPLVFLIGIWGHERRFPAALKFFIFTQAGGLFMLVAILGLFFVKGRATGVYSFDYLHLLGGGRDLSGWEGWLMAGFFLAFAVKLPAFPLHTWLPDAYAEAPTGISILLAGIVSKAAAYGFLRFLVPLFPQMAARFAPAAMVLGVVGILYGALMAFAQSDLKRLIAYSSFSHMGFILLGVFAWNEIALQGVAVIMVAHGLSICGLFMLSGDLGRRLGTRDLGRMGDLWSLAPRMSRVALVLALASLGMPGLVNFVGEFLVLAGVYQYHPGTAVAATIGLILALVYSLWMIQRIFTGTKTDSIGMTDYHGRELVVMSVVIAFLVGLGLYPRPLLDVVRPTLAHLPSLSADTRASRATDARQAGKRPMADPSAGTVNSAAWEP